MEQWVRLLCEHADQLRDSGVTRIRAGAFEAEISPRFPEPGALDDRYQDVGAPDPLNDPDTFGGRLPSFPRRDQ